MSIQIPEDVEPVCDPRITWLAAVKVIGRLHDPLVKEIKADLALQKHEFAESDCAVARLQEGGGKSVTYVPPANLWKLVKAGKITQKQFLQVVSVRFEPLEKILPGNEIDRISETFTPKNAAASGALYAEFKPGFEPDAEKLKAAILSAVAPSPGPAQIPRKPEKRKSAA